jgi:hypothetical protein
MSYRITPYTLAQAKRLGVVVKPSRVSGKKIDVYKDGKKVASVGATGYADYPTFLGMERSGIVERGYAERRRKAYKTRHAKDRKVVGSRGYYADRLLW